jgi:uncharacterized Zn finger protein
MMLTLKNFVQIIDKTILQRGEDYYRYGFVSELEEIATDHWIATVEDAEDNSVNIKIKDSEITESLCSCLHIIGTVCEHEVAVYYAIIAAKENNVIKFPAMKMKSRKKSKSPKKKKL